MSFQVKQIGRVKFRNGRFDGFKRSDEHQIFGGSHVGESDGGRKWRRWIETMIVHVGPREKGRVNVWVVRFNKFQSRSIDGTGSVCRYCEPY